MDLRKAFSLGFHLEGEVDAVFEFGIWIAAVGDALGAIFADDLDGSLFHAYGWGAWHCALFDEGAKSAPGAH